MDIKIEPAKAAPDISVVSITGRIDAYTVDRVKEYLNSLIRIGSHKLICNMAGVEFVAGPGMKALLETIQAARKQGGDMKMCSLQPEVAQPFAASGFAAVAKICASEAEALRDFGVAVDDGPMGFGQTLIAGGMEDIGATLVAPPIDPDAFGATIVQSPLGEDDVDPFGATIISSPSPKNEEDEIDPFGATIIEGPKEDPSGKDPHGLDQTVIESPVVEEKKEEPKVIRWSISWESEDGQSGTINFNSKEFEKKDNVMIIGRSESHAELVVPIPSVSRRHAEVILVGDELEVRDAGSGNGTILNGVPLDDPDSPMTVKSGDEIGLGTKVTLVLNLKD